MRAVNSYWTSETIHQKRRHQIPADRNLRTPTSFHPIFFYRPRRVCYKWDCQL